jgi:nucleoid-associated protein YgaU
MRDFFLRGKITSYPDASVSIDTVDNTYLKPSKFKTHTVRDGDSLNFLAFKYYKDSKEWETIARANDIINPFVLTTGTNLIIPLL